MEYVLNLSDKLNAREATKLANNIEFEITYFIETLKAVFEAWVSTTETYAVAKTFPSEIIKHVVTALANEFLTKSRAYHIDSVNSLYEVEQMLSTDLCTHAELLKTCLIQELRGVNFKAVCHTDNEEKEVVDLVVKGYTLIDVIEREINAFIKCYLCVMRPILNM